METKKVLVTGGDGLIGRAVVQDLRECSYQVTPKINIQRKNGVRKPLIVKILGRLSV